MVRIAVIGITPSDLDIGNGGHFKFKKSHFGKSILGNPTKRGRVIAKTTSGCVFVGTRTDGTSK